MKPVKERVLNIEEKLNSKKFVKRAYSSNEISKILKLTPPDTWHGALKQALLNSHEWQHKTGRMWIYVGPQQPNLFNQPQVKTKPQLQTKPKRREISLFWGLISIK
jgi:hypothetical protein